jgi:plasmanylethanolamine desaturase
LSVCSGRLSLATRASATAGLITMSVARQDVGEGWWKGSEPRLRELPRHDEFSLGRRAAEVLAIATAVLLLAVQFVRVLEMPAHEWWLPVVFVAGAFWADFVSGLVHWSADSWGRETLPLIGRRLLRPFRVHHVNPDDFTRRRFLDVNGDVAMIVVPFLLTMFGFPLEHEWGRMAQVFGFAFCLAGIPTNQVHQWAHMRRPPAFVRCLQRTGIILSRREHSRHHVAPFAQHYCIATGWCNRGLAAIDFFPKLERLITRLTGLQPRDDDSAFQASVAAQEGEGSDG